MNRATDEDDLTSDRNENVPTPSEFLNSMGHWLEHYWDAPREASRWTDLAMVVLTVLIATFAGWSAWIFQGQLAEAQKNTIVSQRAWVGIDRPIYLSSLTFDSQNKGKVSYTVTTKNFGSSVALNVSIWSEAISALDRMEPGLRNSCDAAKVLSGRYPIRDTAGIGIHEPLSPGILFQGDGVGHYFNDRPIETGKFPFKLMIVGCIVYHDQFGTERHTRFCYDANVATKELKAPAFLYQCELGANDAD